MYSQNSNSEAFFNAINEESLKNRSEIIAEANKYKIAELEKARTDAQQMYDDYICLQERKIRKQTGRITAQAASDYRQKVITKRKEITESVFSLAERKLAEFAKSEAYKGFLTESLEKIASVCARRPLEIHIRKEDSAYIPMLEKAAPEGSCIIEDDTVSIGGLVCFCEEKHLKIDDSLSQRLSEQREWFYENSGLNI